MPRLFEDRSCPECGGSHDFWFALDTIRGMSRYSFTCPKTHADGVVELELSSGRVVDGRPGDAVEVYMMAARR